MDDDTPFNQVNTNTTPSDDMDTPEARLRLCKEMQAKVNADKTHYKKSFDRMKEDMRYAKDGTSQEAFKTGKKYVANMLGRYLKNETARLYAKNPKASFKKRERRNYQVWDEDMQTIEAVVQKMATPGYALDPNDQALLQDYQDGMAMVKMYDGMGDTLVKTFNYFLKEQKPKTKTQMKQLVRRTLTCGVGYLKLGYQRELARRAINQSAIDDVTLKMQNMQRLTQDLQNGDIEDDSADMEELRLQMQQLQEDPSAMEVIREGLVFDFPKSTSIIPSMDCENLVGFIGASHVTHEIFLSAKQIQEIWEIKLEANKFTAYERKGSGKPEDGFKQVRTDTIGADLGRMYGCVWEYYDRPTGLVYLMLEGHDNYLAEPTKPNVEVEGFYPIYTLMFNGIEDENEIFPKSDIRLLLPMQDEWNRGREGLREHRMAARPRYAMGKGMLDNDDKAALQNLGAHETIELNLGDKKISEVLMEIPHSGVDQNLYATDHLMQDFQLVSGQSAASGMGATSGTTATEVSAAASSSMSADESSVDELDEFLTEIARDGGQILMLNMTKEKVVEIVGPGAVWPEVEENRLNVVKELYLEIEAGSSGKANKAVDLNNFERIVPLLLQIPGVKPEALTRELVKRLDDRLDPNDFVTTGLSIVAMNAMKQIAPPPGSNSEQQGANGMANAPGAGNEASGSNAPMGAQPAEAPTGGPPTV